MASWCLTWTPPPSVLTVSVTCFLSVKATFRMEPEKATALGFTEVVTDENRRVQSGIGANLFVYSIIYL